MARPRIDGMFYFPHDCNSHCEPEKIEPLMMLHGLAGHAHYFILLEMIYSTQVGRLDISLPEKRKLIARKMFCKEKQFEKILETELKLGLFDRALYEQKGILTSIGISRRRDMVLHERKRKRRGYSGNNPGEITEEPSQNAGKTPEKWGKDKDKEKRESKAGKTSPRSFEEVAFEKAETAWDQLKNILRSSEQGKLVIDDLLSRKIVIDMGGADRVMELHGQNGDTLHQEFIARYSVLDIANFKANKAG